MLKNIFCPLIINRNTGKNNKDMMKRKRIPFKKIKKLLDPDFINKFFNKRYRRYYKEAKGCRFLGIKKIKRFAGGKSISASYFLKLKIGKEEKIKIIDGRARQRLFTDENNPQRHYLVLKHLYTKNFSREVPRPLDYQKPYNLLLYEEVEGEALQQKLMRGEISFVLSFIPKIVFWLRKLHRENLLKGRLAALEGSNRILLRDKKVEAKEMRHALFLTKKFYPQGTLSVKKVVEKLNKLRRKKKNWFLEKENYALCHYDVHFGNFLTSDRQLKVIDFSDACFYDPLADLACFLVQTESMLEYYQRKKAKIILPRIKNQIINLYFKRQPERREIFRLKYFEIRRLVSMFTSLIFVEGEEKNKKLMLDDFKKKISLKFKQIEGTL
ncbi:MAG: hypothetical protein AUK09_02460 [Parcubacteria group bacterium CG2_30_36_38]|nr:MAG: hypothetical protein AUK09_02460 [Parcubacteria group bacterium CG2_30_36_38]